MLGVLGIILKILGTVILWILGIVLGLIIILMFIPVGADVAYEGGEFRLSAKVCGILLKLLPKDPESQFKPKKEPKPKKEKKPKKQKPADEEKPKKKLELNFTFDEIMALLKAVLRGLGRFGKISVDRFKLHWIAAGDDPYKTATTFGYVNAGLSALAPICAKKFTVKDSDVFTDVDFTAEKMSIDFGLAITIRIGTVFGAVFKIIFGVLWIFIKSRVRLLFEKIRSKKNNSKSIEINNGETENTIQAEERNDSNG